jgi:MraZ protein
VFQGATALTLDAKGRLAIPARHRELLNGEVQAKLVLTVHPHGCLLLYPTQIWEPIRERTLKLSDLNLRKARWKRLLIGMAEEVIPDAQGRILIAQSLRDFAGIEKQATMAGQGHHFEIWAEAAWKRQLDETRSEIEQSAESAEEDFTL